MNIRPLLPADAEPYRELRLRALRECPEAFTSSHEEESAKPPEWYARRLAASQFWGAFAQQGLCGVVGLEREPRTKNRHKATVVGMYVVPECSGQGAGSRLLAALVDDARRSGIELLVLTVTAGNGAAERLYERAGFRTFGIEPRAIRVGGRYLSKNHMALELDPA